MVGPSEKNGAVPMEPKIEMGDWSIAIVRKSFRIGYKQMYTYVLYIYGIVYHIYIYMYIYIYICGIQQKMMNLCGFPIKSGAIFTELSLDGP